MMSESSAARPREQAAVLPPELQVRQERVGCYTGLYEAQASVVRPKDVEELREVFRFARASGRRVTMRGGGHSFDAQPIGDDLVVSTERLNSIELADGDRVRVGPGATLGQDLRRDPAARTRPGRHRHHGERDPPAGRSRPTASRASRWPMARRAHGPTASSCSLPKESFSSVPRRPRSRAGMS